MKISVMRRVLYKENARKIQTKFEYESLSLWKELLLFRFQDIS